MFDKEKLEKENEQFSSAILYVATAVYVGVCAMVFGALYAKLPSFGDAFLAMMKDYGTIITGIPVLVAVVVAKQQLDASRRQHVATVKRSLKGQLDAIKTVRHFLTSIDKLVSQGIDYSNRNSHLFVWLLDKEELEMIKEHLPSSISTHCEGCSQRVVKFIEDFHDGTNERERLQSSLGLIASQAMLVKSRTDWLYQELSEYWS
ncbi:hypothetical protein [Brucella intermedia]|uniref:hypothetical protein n=1 Tax=Brucella intermedia TaxID=94625 RepID=UPI00224B55AF|nr:hypothetical protein [Brucella intermedia]